MTRYTNSQHPISERDFQANDNVQIRLQNESFNTQLWYEKRQDEFRGEMPNNIKIIPNFVFANAYLAYELQAPAIVLQNSQNLMKGDSKDLLFLSHQEQSSGLYERVFNENTQFEDMLCSMYLLRLLANSTANGDFNQVFTSHLIYRLALFKVIFSKYINHKYAHVPPVNKKVKELVEKGESARLLKIYQLIDVKMMEEPEWITESHYEKIKEHFAKMDI